MTRQKYLYHGMNSCKSNTIVLSGHFSSIGIGDVFLEPPTTLLPSVYLASSSSSSSSSPSSPSSFSLLKQGSSSRRGFLSREIVGKIKDSPEDFIVREIALPDRVIPGLKDVEIEAMRIASIAATTFDQYDNNGKMDVSALDEILPPSKRRRKRTRIDKNPTRAEETADPSALDDARAQPDMESSLAGRKSNEHQILTLDAASSQIRDGSQCTEPSIDRCLEQGPLEVLRSILEKTLPKSPLDGPKSTDDVLESIRTLRENLLEAIRRVPSSSTSTDGEMSFNGASLAESVGEIWIPPLVTNGPKDRGVFHRAVRAVFPLLQSESVAPSPSNTNQEGNGTFSSHKVKIYGDPIFFDLIPFLFEPCLDLPPLYDFYHSRLESNVKNPILRLRPGLERQERAPVHRLLASKSRNSLVSSTITQRPNNDTQMTAISVSWSRNTKRIAKRKRTRLDATLNDDPNPNSLFVLRKYQKDHTTAHKMLVSAFRCPRSEVTFAGKKDLLAITEQFCTVRAKTPDQVAQAAKRLHGLQLGKAVKVNWMTQTGDLAGNRFEITIRDVQRISVAFGEDGPGTEELDLCDDQHICSCVQRINNYGFINFYGEQRVGLAGNRSKVGVRPFEIGRALLKEDFIEAIDLIMAGREVLGDKGQEHEDIRRARKSWIEQGRDPEVTAKLLPKCGYLSKERLVLNGLKRYNGNAKAALQCIPLDDHSFWITTYQSYIWNMAATERIRLYGSQRAVPGDLVLCPGTSDSPHILEDNTNTGDETDIRNVVLPLPGTKVVFPTNKVGEYIANILKADGIDITRQNEDSRRGSYRHLVAPAFNLHHSVIEENDARHIWLQFDLPSGSFATMLLRELMSTTVSRDQEPGKN